MRVLSRNRLRVKNRRPMRSVHAILEDVLPASAETCFLDTCWDGAMPIPSQFEWKNNADHAGYFCKCRRISWSCQHLLTFILRLYSIFPSAASAAVISSNPHFGGLIQHRDRRHHKTSLHPTPAGPSFPRAPSNFHFIIKPENSGKLVTYPRFRFVHAKPFAHARDLQDSSLGPTHIQSYMESLRQSTAKQAMHSPNGPN